MLRSRGLGKMSSGVCQMARAALNLMRFRCMHAIGQLCSRDAAIMRAKQQVGLGGGHV